MREKNQNFAENNLGLSLFTMKIVDPLQKKRHFLMQVPLDILERGLKMYS